MYRRLLHVRHPICCAACFLCTLATALCSVAFSFFICRQLAPELSWQANLAIILLMRVFGQFAIQGLAGLGTSEPVLFVLFCFFGLRPTEALAVTVLGRAFYLVLIVAGAAIGSILWIWRNRFERGIDRNEPRTCPL